MDLLKNNKLIKHAEMSQQEIAYVSGAQTLFNIMDLRGLSNIAPIVRPFGFNTKKRGAIPNWTSMTRLVPDGDCCIDCLDCCGDCGDCGDCCGNCNGDCCE